MSKFIERLKQLSEGAPQPIGFRARGTAAEKLKIQLVAAVAGAEEAELAAGADAVFLYAEPGRAPKTGVPWGFRLSGQPCPEGCDFVVLTPEAPIAASVKGEVGKVMAIGRSLPGDVVRAVSGVQIDAALLLAAEEGNETLTWNELIEFHRLAMILSKPLLVEVPVAITGPEIEQVWQAGASGIVVRVGAGQEGRLQELRTAIGELTAPVPPRAGRTAVRAPMAPAPAPEDEEDDDDE